MGWRNVQFPSLVLLKLDRLRYLRANIIRGPTRIDMWRKIECLKYISYKDWMRCSSKLMVGSCSLRELQIYLKQIEPQELSKIKVSLEKMENLAILYLLGTFEPIDIALAIPQLSNLTKLKVKGMMLKFLAASMFTPNLYHLTMCISYLDDPMPELGKLAKLLYLKIDTYADERMQRRLSLPQSFHSCILDRVEMYRCKRRCNVSPQALRLRGCPALEINNMPKHINISVDVLNNI